MSMSPERTIAPPISAGSTAHVSRTSRRRRVLRAAASRSFWRSSRAVAETTSTSATLRSSASSSLKRAAISGRKSSRPFSVSRARKALPCASRSAPQMPATSPSSCPVETPGLRSSFWNSSLSTTSRAVESQRDHWSSVPPSRATANAALAYGLAMVALSAMSYSGSSGGDRPSGLGALDLAGQLLDQVGVGLGVDLALEKQRRAGHCQLRHVLAESVASAGLLERHFLARVAHEALAFGDGGGAGFLDDLVRPAVGLVDDLQGLLARLVDDALSLAARLVQLLLATLGGRQAVGNLLLAVFDRLEKGGPDELDAEPDQDQEDDGLPDERRIDVHGDVLARRRALTLDCGQERVRDREEHRERDTDQERRVDQAGEQEHAALQRGDQLRLAGGRLEELRTHDADADAGADRAQADDQADAQRGEGLDLGEQLYRFH